MTSEADNPWKARLHERLRGRPTPMLVMPDSIWSAASLWAGSRAWIGAFRAAGLAAGDRLVCALPEGPAFVQVILACLWEEIICAPISPQGDVREAMTAVDARAVVVTNLHALADAGGVYVPDAASQPPRDAPSLRVAAVQPPRGVALLLAAPALDGAAVWLEWSHSDLLVALDGDGTRYPAEGARVLSVRPWHDASGLIFGLLSAILHADEVVRDASGGQDLDVVALAAREHEITHLELTSRLAEQLRAHPRREELFDASCFVISTP